MRWTWPLGSSWKHLIQGVNRFEKCHSWLKYIQMNYKVYNVTQHLTVIFNTISRSIYYLHIASPSLSFYSAFLYPLSLLWSFKLHTCNYVVEYIISGRLTKCWSEHLSSICHHKESHIFCNKIMIMRFPLVALVARPGQALSVQI